MASGSRSVQVHIILERHVSSGLHPWVQCQAIGSGGLWPGLVMVALFKRIEKKDSIKYLSRCVNFFQQTSQVISFYVNARDQIAALNLLN